MISCDSAWYDGALDVAPQETLFFFALLCKIVHYFTTSFLHFFDKNFVLVSNKAKYLKQWKMTLGNNAK